MGNAVAIRDREGSAPEPVTDFAPRTFGELLKFADLMAQTNFVPQAYRGKQGDIVAAVQMGAEDGLGPMAALRNIAVINGRPCYYGDAIPGLAIAKGYIRDVQDHYEGKEGTDAYASVVTVTKKDGSTLTRRFSIGDAKRAGLHGKSGPWQNYGSRMLYMRARSWAIRDAAPHAQFGPTYEELREERAQEAKDVTPRRQSLDDFAASEPEPQVEDQRQDPEPEDTSQEQPDLVTLWVKEGREEQITLDEAAAKVEQMIKAAKSLERATSVWDHNFRPVLLLLPAHRRDTIEGIYNDARDALESQGALV